MVTYEEENSPANLEFVATNENKQVFERLLKKWDDIFQRDFEELCLFDNGDEKQKAPQLKIASVVELLGGIPSRDENQKEKMFNFKNGSISFFSEDSGIATFSAGGKGLPCDLNVKKWLNTITAKENVKGLFGAEYIYSEVTVSTSIGYWSGNKNLRFYFVTSKDVPPYAILGLQFFDEADASHNLESSVVARATSGRITLSDFLCGIDAKDVITHFSEFARLLESTKMGALKPALDSLDAM